MHLIRPAVLEDSAGLAKVQVDSYRSAYAGLLPKAYLEAFTYEEQQQDWLELLGAGTNDILLVAISVEKQVTGYALAKAKLGIYPGYDSEIVALHVRQAFQRHGIGRALMSKAIESLQERGCKSVMLWTLKNNTTRRWYERLDGKLLGEKNYKINDLDVTEVAYGWENITALFLLMATGQPPGNALGPHHSRS
jgi:ribosomal protein S18 acetylase RimI-like enzyme